jgi:hypothetical protein
VLANWHKRVKSSTSKISGHLDRTASCQLSRQRKPHRGLGEASMSAKTMVMLLLRSKPRPSSLARYLKAVKARRRVDPPATRDAPKDLKRSPSDSRMTLDDLLFSNAAIDAGACPESPARSGTISKHESSAFFPRRRQRPIVVSRSAQHPFDAVFSRAGRLPIATSLNPFWRIQDCHSQSGFRPPDAGTRVASVLHGAGGTACNCLKLHGPGGTRGINEVGAPTTPNKWRK